MWEKIKALFRALFGSDVVVKTNIDKHDKKIVSKKKLSRSVDNSSISNIDKQFTYTNNGIIQNIQNEERVETDDKFILTARWYYLVPHKIVKENNGIDQLNILKPRDESFVKPSLTLYYDSNRDKYHGVYFLAKCNNAIANLKVERLELVLDTCSCTLNTTKNIFGTIETDKSFVLFESSMNEGEGIVQIDVSYEKNEKTYKQIFSFTASNNSKEFVMSKYSKPIEIREPQEV